MKNKITKFLAYNQKVSVICADTTNLVEEVRKIHDLTPCQTDEEAKSKAAALQCGKADKYPAVYFNSDTTGEKAYEEFFVPGEKIDMQSFQSLGVIEQAARHNMQEVDSFFEQLEAIFAKHDFTKEQVVDAIRAFIPTFEHEERGKNLDQKM